MDTTLAGLFDGGGFFAHHPSDEQRAFSWLIHLRREGIGWAEARKQLNAYMTYKGWVREHIDAQIVEAESRLRLWLID